MKLYNFFNNKKIENIEKEISIKICFQQVLMFFSMLLFILLTTLSYVNGLANVNLDDLSLTTRLFRSIFPVFLTWYLFSIGWSIKTGIDLIISNKKTWGIINILSFLPLISLVTFIKFASCIDKEVIFKYKELLFSQDQDLKSKYKWGNWRRTLILIIWIISLPVCAFIFLKDNFSELSYKNNIWFFSFNYFTIQTNLMVLFFTTALLFFPGLKIFKNNNLHMTLVIYIFIVGLTWNALLLPSDIKNGNVNNYSNINWTTTAWYHIVNPICFTIFSLILIFVKPVKKTTKFINIFRISMVYPFMYLLFVSIVPFTAGVSIYGSFTNVNPNLLINGPGSNGSYTYFGLIIGFWFLFLLLTLFIWFVDKKNNIRALNKNN